MFLSTSEKPADKGFWATAVEDFRQEREGMKGMGFLQSAKHLFVRYGLLGIVVYDFFFVVSAGGLYAVASMVSDRPARGGSGGAIDDPQNNNWGLDINPILDNVGLTDTVMGMLRAVGMAEEGEPLSPGATSLALAIVGTELGEFWRLPLTLFLLPTISRRVLGRDPGALKKAEEAAPTDKDNEAAPTDKDSEAAPTSKDSEARRV